MDLDAYTASRRDEWDRLDELSRRSRPDGPATDELIDRYQSAATDLSRLRSISGSTDVGESLAVSLGRARLRLADGGRDLLRQMPEFFVLQLPAALYRLRWWTLAMALFTIIIGVLWAGWALSDPRMMASLGTPSERARFAEEDFTAYYTNDPSSVFATSVWANNAFIAAQCIAFGITGVWVPYILLSNAQGLGTSAAVMADHGRLGDFFLNIAPHGLLELTAIFVAGAAGMRIFWALVAPGTLPRAVSLAREGRAMFTVVVGLVLALALSGLVEGFVTGAEMPWALKIGIGVAALGVFLFYMLVVGRRAVRAGEDGDLDEVEAGVQLAYAE